VDAVEREASAAAGTPAAPPSATAAALVAATAATPLPESAASPLPESATAAALAGVTRRTAVPRRPRAARDGSLAGVVACACNLDACLEARGGVAAAGEAHGLLRFLPHVCGW